MTTDRRGWRSATWFLIPAVLIGVVAAVVSLIVALRDDSGPESDDGVVRADDPVVDDRAIDDGLGDDAGFVDLFESLTTTVRDLDDAVVRADRRIGLPVVRVSPSQVATPGTYEFLVTGEGWTTRPFVLPCDRRTRVSGGSLDPFETCDAANLTEATPIDGFFEVAIVVTVPAEGLAVAAGDPTGVEVSIDYIDVG